MSDVTFEMPDETETDEVELPAVLPVLPLKETVVFPQSMTPLAIGQERSVRLIDDVVAGDRLLALVTAKDSSIETPDWDDIHEIGTVAIVHKMIKVPDGTQRILVGGLHRVRIAKRVSDDPYLVAKLEAVPDVLRRRGPRSRRSCATCRASSRASSASRRTCPRSCSSPRRTSTTRARSRTSSPRRCARSRSRSARRSSRRSTSSSGCARSPAILYRELEVFELGSKIQSQVQSEMEKGQREYFLRQQLKAIQAELGEGDPEQAEVDELRERIAALHAARRRARRRPTASCRGSSACRRRRPSTA